MDWRNATITIPPRDGCPEGPVSFVAVSDIQQNAIGLVVQWTDDTSLTYRWNGMELIAVDE